MDTCSRLPAQIRQGSRHPQHVQSRVWPPSSSGKSTLRLFNFVFSYVKSIRKSRAIQDTLVSVAMPSPMVTACVQAITISSASNVLAQVTKSFQQEVSNWMQHLFAKRY